MEQAYIYSIIDNDINKIVYIGQHNGNNKYYHSSSLILKKYRNKYGWKIYFAKFKLNIIEYCNKEQLDERECYWIKHYDTYKNGFNLTEGGTKFLAKNIILGKTFPIKNQKLKGQKRSNETKELLKLRKKGYKPNIKCHENNSKKLSKKLLQYDLNGNFIKEWINGKQAASDLNIKSYGDISACCLNKQKTAHGFIWVYKDNIIKLKINPKSKNNYPKNRKSRNE